MAAPVRRRYSAELSGVLKSALWPIVLLNLILLAVLCVFRRVVFVTTTRPESGVTAPNFRDVSEQLYYDKLTQTLF